MMAKLAENVKAAVVKTTIISSQKIKDHYSLPSNHPPFILFQDEVNNKICEEAILSTYGTFNTITDPILTYTQVRITKTNLILVISNLLSCNHSFSDQSIRIDLKAGSSTSLRSHSRVIGQVRESE